MLFIPHWREDLIHYDFPFLQYTYVFHFKLFVKFLCLSLLDFFIFIFLRGNINKDIIEGARYDINHLLLSLQFFFSWYWLVNRWLLFVNTLNICIYISNVFVCLLLPLLLLYIYIFLIYLAFGWRWGYDHYCILVYIWRYTSTYVNAYTFKLKLLLYACVCVQTHVCIYRCACILIGMNKNVHLLIIYFKSFLKFYYTCYFLFFIIITVIFIIIIIFKYT